MEVKVSRQYSSVLIQDLYIYLYICMEVKVSRQYSSVLIQDLFRGAMNDRDGWRERVKETYAGSAT